MSKAKLKKLGILIAKKRQLLRFTQDEIAKEVGIDRGYLSMIERGVVNPSALILYKIQEVFSYYLHYYLI